MLVTSRSYIAVFAAFIVVSVGLLGTASAQVSQEVIDSISTPNEVKISVGTLKFLDGAPYPETAEKVYNFLDTMRGVDAFLKGIPGASMYGLIEGGHSLGAVECHQVVIMDKLMDSQSLYLTGNTSTMYVIPALDLKRDGPTVFEAPPGALGAFNDAWFRFVQNVGPAGPDKGKVALTGDPAGHFSKSYENLKPFVKWYEWGGASIEPIVCRVERSSRSASVVDHSAV